MSARQSTPEVGKKLLWFAHPVCERHEMGEGHPEQPARLNAVEQAVAASPLAAARLLMQPEPAERGALIRAHDAHFVDRVLASAPASGYHRLDADTVMNPHSVEAALRAAGAAVQAVDCVLGPGPGLAFCAVRPPGHHAERAAAMGFCLFDNVAIGAHAALAQGLKRVAILDFDVHYGNGTVDIFRGDARVLVCNTYQYPLYPMWADGGGADNLVDAPLKPGSGGKEFREAVNARWLPALKRFAPELILISAGFDAHRDDPLANLNLLEDDYGWAGALIREQAERSAGGRVVATLEGGYNLPALGASAVAFLTGLLGAKTSN